MRRGMIQPSHPPQDEPMNSPMPISLDVVSWFKVTDSDGRMLRSEELKAGADLHDRLRLAHRNYQLQGWTVDPLLPGRWNFCARKAGRQLLIGVRAPAPRAHRTDSQNSLPIHSQVAT
jgi:hypothetical protein